MKLNPEQTSQLDRFLDMVRANGMRRTRALTEVLEVLLTTDGPLSLNDLLAKKGPLRGMYSMPTLARLINRLELIGIVQKLGFRERATYLTLRLENRHHDYLICTECGTIETLEIACPVQELESKIARKHRFSKVYHELEFYGVCPVCS